MTGPALVTGAAGFVGGALIHQAAAIGLEVVGTVRASPADAPAETRQIDLRDPEAVRGLVRSVRPALVVSTAYVQSEWEATAVAPVHLAAAAHEVGADLVHVSSDAVFAGGSTPRDEGSAPDPISAYGAAKAAAEVGVRAVHPGAGVVRISLQLGAAGSGTERFVADVVSGRRDAVLFTDDVKCAAHVDDTASALLELAGRPGIHHLPGADAVTRLELAQLVCARHGWPTDRLRAGTRAESGLSGLAEIHLDGRRTLATLRTRMRGAREFLSPDA